MLFLSMAASSLASAPAFAAPPSAPVIDIDAPEASDGALADAARASFAEGVRWYKKKKYNQALAAFLQAYALTKDPAILVNLGQTHLRLNNPLNATRYFQKFLDEAKDAKADLRSRVEQQVADARKQLGAIEVSAPEGAELSIDGEVVGRAPLSSAVDVMPGKHEVSMSSSAGTKSETVEVGKGAKVPIRLMPRVAPRPVAPPPPAKEGEAPEEPGFFAPPKAVAPVYVAGAIGIVAFTTAIVLGGIRVNADRNASTATEALVRNGKNPASCTDSAALAGDPTITGACAEVRETDRILEKTKDPFTAALWTGVGTAAIAVGWYFLAPKERATAPTGSRGPLYLAPSFGASGAGASVGGAF